MAVHFDSEPPRQDPRARDKHVAARAGVISRMVNVRKFYARVVDWLGELEIVSDEAGEIVGIMTFPDASGASILLSLPRGEALIPEAQKDNLGN